MDAADISISGCLGRCGDRAVFLGFAPASLLVKISFADIFDELKNHGYQRPFNRTHSVEFKKYIQSPGATTIPLTFNLRTSDDWRIETTGGVATLTIRADAAPVMAQVDCQHRLGFLGDSNISFAFMAFLSLEVTEEMSIFRDINGKAKGLSSSLLDSTEAQLVGDRLPETNPELYYAIQLSDNVRSPWRGHLDKGGQATVGMLRTATIRTMQNAIRRFLKAAEIPIGTTHQSITDLLIDFWTAVSFVLPYEWSTPRKHVVTKGVGVYALTSFAADLVREARNEQRICDLNFFIGRLSDFLHLIDWSSQGAMKGYGGTGGASAALELLRHTRKQALNITRQYGKQEHSAY
ncbi:hypothetical protein R75471_01676 [Paraburkholderia domus]|uniref:DGQHR domain-containing protein n=1 Tax=Paraburkholderia domus TaxID=2793075 RepID=UPI001B0487EE|nr:DGQHR domain-containing protein [Paraburkholderia domus]CAE6879049.1 hypothetical protein R75471_01676 [Paraburkholderia domus]